MTKKDFKFTDGRKRTNETFGGLAGEYRKLTDEKLDSWDNKAKMFSIKSIGRSAKIKNGRTFFYYVNLNLLEIGEPIKYDAPKFLYPQYIINVRFEFIKEVGNKEIKLYFDKGLEEDTKIILSATEPMGMGKRRIDDSWYKKICVIGNEFMPGDSILARYLQVYKDMNEEFYKICFKYREVNKKSGISGNIKVFSMYSEPENLI